MLRGAWDGPYRISRGKLIVASSATGHHLTMLGFAITSWMRFFAFGLVAGLMLSFVSFDPIAFLGKIDAVAAFLGLVLTTMYARSYEPVVWRRLVTRAHRVKSVSSLSADRDHRPLPQ